MFLNLLHKSLFFILTPFPPSLRNLMINGYKRGSGRGKVSVMVIFSRGEPPLVTCRQPGSGTPADVGKMSNQAGVVGVLLSAAGGYKAPAPAELSSVSAAQCSCQHTCRQSARGQQHECKGEAEARG